MAKTAVDVLFEGGELIIVFVLPGDRVNGHVVRGSS